MQLNLIVMRYQYFSRMDYHIPTQNLYWLMPTLEVIPDQSCLTSTPGPYNEYSIYRPNEFFIDKLNSILTIHLPVSWRYTYPTGADKIIDLTIKIFEKISIPALDQYLVALSKVLNDRFTLRDCEIWVHSLITLYIRLRRGVQQPGSMRQREGQDEPPRRNTRSQLNLRRAYRDLS